MFCTVYFKALPQMTCMSGWMIILLECQGQSQLYSHTICLCLPQQSPQLLQSLKLYKQYHSMPFNSTQCHAIPSILKIPHTEEMHFLQQGWYWMILSAEINFPAHFLLPRECVGKYYPGDSISWYTPLGKYQTHILAWKTLAIFQQWRRLQIGTM